MLKQEQIRRPTNQSAQERAFKAIQWPKNQILKPPNNTTFDSLNNLPPNYISTHYMLHGPQMQILRFRWCIYLRRSSNDWNWILDILNPEYSTYGTTLGSPLHDLYSDDLCPDDLCLDDLCPDDLCYDDLCPNDRYINFETSKRKPSLRLNTAFL